MYSHSINMFCYYNINLPFRLVAQSGHRKSGRFHTVTARMLHGNPLRVRYHGQQGRRTRPRRRPADVDHLHEEQIR